MRILVLNAGGLHLGYVGCYGCDWVPTPHLDRLAAEGVVFDQHLADHPKLVPLGQSMHRSAWTGRFGPPLVRDGRADNVLADLLKSRDINSAFLTIDDWNGLRSDSWVERLTASPCLVWLDLPSLAPPWQMSEKDLEPFFLNTDTEDEEPLTPWLDPSAGPIDPEGIELGRVRTTYAAVIAHFDKEMGGVLDVLGEGGLDETLLVLTADCGLALGEHGVLGEYRAWLHDEVVHVPLLMRLPAAAEAGRRVAALTQPIDLFPTLLEALGLPAPVNHGSSLWPLLRGEAEHIRPYACSGLQVGESIEWCLRTPQWALLLPRQTPDVDGPRSPQLYVKPDDRWEVNDVRPHYLELTERMEKTLHLFAAAAQHPGALQAPELPVEGEAPDADAV